MTSHRQRAPATMEPITPPRQVLDDTTAGSSQPHSQAAYNHNGHRVTKGVHPDGESGRRGFHPLRFFQICFRSNCTASKWLNLLWPLVPVAVAVHFALAHSKHPNHRLTIFILSYIAMLPSANLLGFAGGELALKLPKVLGVFAETFLGAVVEIILFTTLLVKDNQAQGKNLIPVIQDAILGSILANLLLCLGLCFFAGGLRKKEQSFDEAVSEVGSGLLLVAGMGLLVPAAFSTAVNTEGSRGNPNNEVLTISRLTAIMLMVAFFIYIFFQTRTHQGIYTDILERDEEKNVDRPKELRRAKLTFTECIIAVLIALTCVSLIAVFLVLEIESLVHEYNVHEAFVGLILLPLAEKAAEQISAIDNAWDNQMNFALSHVLGATLQTALFNAPLVVLIGWGLHKNMNLDFEIFMVAILVLAIVVVGNFLRDGKSNYLEGALCVIVYVIIAITTWYIPTANKQEPGKGHTVVHPS